MENSVSGILLETVSRTAAVTMVPAKDGQELDGEYMGAVVLSGITIVFTALVLLILFVWLMAKIFDLARESKKQKPVIKEELRTETAAQSEKPSLPAEKAPDIESGISEEVIAAISAAVAMLGEETGRTLKVSGISRAGSGSSSRRGRWGDAAASENTRSFF